MFTATETATLAATSARLNISLAELNAFYLKRLSVAGKANADAFMWCIVSGASPKVAHLTAEPLAVRG
jgi:hypothetical protein